MDEYHSNTHLLYSYSRPLAFVSCSHWRNLYTFSGHDSNLILYINDFTHFFFLGVLSTFSWRKSISFVCWLMVSAIRYFSYWWFTYNIWQHQHITNLLEHFTLPGPWRVSSQYLDYVTVKWSDIIITILRQKIRSTDAVYDISIYRRTTWARFISLAHMPHPLKKTQQSSLTWCYTNICHLL